MLASERENASCIKVFRSRSEIAGSRCKIQGFGVLADICKLVSLDRSEGRRLAISSLICSCWV